jgi:competence ComEA-like helix-hairpin-helix protein
MAQSAKLDVNAATREELVQATGIRPALADAILQHREAKGPFASIEALLEVPGIGAARLQQLKATLAVAEPDAAAAPVAAMPEKVEATVAAVEPAKVEPVPEPEPVAAVAEPVAVPAEAAAEGEPVSEPAPSVVAKPELAVVAAPVAVAAERAAEATAPQPVRQSPRQAEGDLAGLWLSLAAEQMSHGLETWGRLVAARSWHQAALIQGEYLRGSLERLLAGLERSTRLAGGFAALERTDLDRAA